MAQPALNIYLSREQCKGPSPKLGEIKNNLSEVFKDISTNVSGQQNPKAFMKLCSSFSKKFDSFSPNDFKNLMTLHEAGVKPKQLMSAIEKISDNNSSPSESLRTLANICKNLDKVNNNYEPKGKKEIAANTKSALLNATLKLINKKGSAVISELTSNTGPLQLHTQGQNYFPFSQAIGDLMDKKYQE